jgi:PAS domain S-box-containing protein
MTTSSTPSLYLINKQFSTLFEGLSGVLYFVKDRESRLISGNTLLAEHLGYKKPSEIIGKNDFDLFPIELAQQYREDDLNVISTGKEKKNIIELFPNYLGDLNWFITTKIPLRDSQGEICGVCGTLTHYENSNQFMRPFKEISKALNYLKSHYSEKISNKKLATVAGVSVRQFEIRFKEIFKCTAHQYIIKLRILKSCKLLLQQNLTISEVALELGFYDQGAFSNTFKKQIGLSPLKYINKHRVSNSG